MKNFKKLIATTAIATAALASIASAATISFSQKKIMPRVGNSRKLKANVTLASGETADKGKVKWKSSDKKIATVDANGLLKAKKAGKTTVTATLPNGKSAKLEVQVVPKLALNATSVTVAKGKTKGLNLIYFDDTKATWTSSNPKVVTVDKKGTVTGVKVGKATVTATYKTHTFKCKVTVKKANMKLKPASATAYIGDKTYLKPSEKTKKMKWKSSNPKVAKVDKNGKVTALHDGKATITATNADGIEGKCKIVVKAKRSSLKFIPDGNDSSWNKKCQDAMNYIKKDKKSYDMVLRYLGAVEQVKKVTQTRKSNMDVFTDTPTFTAGPSIYENTLYFSSCIVHDAYHSKMYHDAESAGRNGKSEYEGKAAEVTCCKIQRDYLKAVAKSASYNDAYYANYYANYMQEIIDNPDSNQYWVSWEKNPY